MCPSANILILLYSIKRFLEVSVCLPLSSCPKRWNLFFDTQVPVWKPETLDACSYLYHWLVSINNVLPTTGRLSCERLKLSQFKQCFSSLCLKPTTHHSLHSIQRELTDQTRQICEELWAECLIPKPITQSVWLMPHDECSLLAALTMEGTWTLGGSALNLAVRTRRSPALCCKGKVRLWTGWCECSPFRPGSL